MTSTGANLESRVNPCTMTLAADVTEPFTQAGAAVAAHKQLRPRRVITARLRGAEVVDTGRMGGDTHTLPASRCLCHLYPTPSLCQGRRQSEAAASCARSQWAESPLKHKRTALVQHFGRIYTLSAIDSQPGLTNVFSGDSYKKIEINFW